MAADAGAVSLSCGGCRRLKEQEKTMFGKAGTALGVACAALVGALMTVQQASADEKVSVRLSYTPFAAHIPVYVAKAKGYFGDAGLNVDILPGRGSTFAAMTVGAGKEEFGVSDAAAVLTARAKGVPIIALSNLQQDNGVAWIATEKSGITKVEDLKGRNVGILPGSSTTIFLQALMKKHGLTLDDVKPITWRPGTDLPLLLEGKIDSEATVYNNEVIAWGIEHPELKLRVQPMASLGFDTPGYALVTSEELARKNPKMVKAFNAAALTGMEYAVAHPEEAVAILVQGAPELKPNVEAAKWKEMIPATSSRSVGPGGLDRAKWEALNELLKTYGMIEAKVDLSAVLKSEFR
jgi:NitT/TauT family transport system substrate-binding protein